MTHLGIASGDWLRTVAKEAAIPLYNRYFEEDPVPLDGQAALIARPALRKWLEVGTGPVRGFFNQVGMFDNGLMIVSGGSLYKIKPDETVTLIGSGIEGDGYVPMCCTDRYLFLADGTNLWIYTDNDAASGTLTVTGAISSGEQVVIGGVYYQFTSASVDAGTPAGSSANPWLVALGSSISEALDNLSSAILNTGLAGKDYSSALTGHTSALVREITSDSLTIAAQVIGPDGNSIATTETLANGSWSGATLSGGGSSFFGTVPMPDNVGAMWCDTLASFVLVAVAAEYNENGRFYWIEPGANSVDPLNFATAERAPDPLHAIVVLGDVAWLLGATVTEPWYATGDSLAPFQRMQGQLFDHGVWKGTAVPLGDDMIVVDANGVVWCIGAAGSERISNYGVEQRIRESMALQLRAE